MKQISINSGTVISRDINLERYLKDIRKFPSLTYAEERTIILAAKSGNKDALKKLIESNLRFVVNCAKEYQHPDINVIDLISAGNEGLIEAVEKFDLGKEIKFISYAVWWIKNSIIEFLKENTKTIRLPYNKQSEIRQYLNAKEKLEQKLETSLGLDQVEELTGTDFTHVRETIAYNNKADSINNPISNGEEDGILEDLISDPQADFTQTYDQDFKKKAIYQSLNKLTPVQREIIQLSFGLGNNIEQSNEDIAKRLKLSAERIRQIKKQALTRLSKVNGLDTCF